MIPASVNIIPEAPVRDIVALGTLAEDLGYERCWLYDEGLATRDVYVSLAALATATSRIGIGTGITNPYTRHPATTATTVATLDELSGGRSFLGLGAGGSLTLGPLGVDRSQPLRAVRDAMSACRGLLDGASVTMSSPTFSLQDARIGFPVRRGIEIWVAGRGPRMLDLGGELADGVMLDFIHKATLGDYVNLVRRGGERVGRRARVAYSTMIITDDQAMAQTKPHMTYRLLDSPPGVKAALGITDGDLDRIRGAMGDGLHAAAEFVRDEWVLPFVIAGSADECAGELGHLIDEHGIDEFVLPILDLRHGPALMRTVADVLARV